MNENKRVNEFYRQRDFRRFMRRSSMWPFFGLVVVVLLYFGVWWTTGRYASNLAVITFPDGTVVHAEIADSNEERRVGLSGHAFLNPDRGMLFLFDEPALQSFWMKEMDFPIDIVWISGETVVGVESDVPVPVPGTGTLDLPKYVSETPVDRVLEVNAGFAAARGLDAGDRLDIELP